MDVFFTVLCFIIAIYIWRKFLEPGYYYDLDLPPIFYSERYADDNDNCNYQYSYENESLSHSFYNVAIYRSRLEPDSCFMVNIYPQGYHFFIENGRVIYHPTIHDGSKIDAVLKHYKCCSQFELAYELPVNNNEQYHHHHHLHHQLSRDEINNDNDSLSFLSSTSSPSSPSSSSSSSSDNSNPSPRVICHRNLEYLTTHVYTEKIYLEEFDTLQRPTDVINRFFARILKIEGTNEMVRGLST